MTEAKIRHLEMIRNAIDGASGNSLRIKGFAMLLLAGALALTLPDGAEALPFIFALTLCLIIGALGTLDFYFILRSDLFRLMYNDVSGRADDEIDFSMETAQYHEQLIGSYGNRFSLQIWVSILLYYNVIVVIIASSLLPLPS